MNTVFSIILWAVNLCMAKRDNEATTGNITSMACVCMVKEENKV